MKKTMYQSFILKAITENRNRNPNTILFQLKSYFDDVLKSSIISTNQSESGVVCDSLLILGSFFAKGLSFRMMTFASNTTLSNSYVKSLAFLCLAGRKRIPNAILLIGQASIDSNLFSIDTKLYCKQIQSNQVRVIKPNFISYIIRNKQCLGFSHGSVERRYTFQNAQLFIRGNKAVLMCPKDNIQEILQSPEFKRHYDFIRQCMVIGISKEAGISYA